MIPIRWWRRQCWNGGGYSSIIVVILSLLLINNDNCSSFLLHYPISKVYVGTQRYEIFLRESSIEDESYINNDDYDDDYDDDDETTTIKPYRNRSLAWTIRYRTLNPYEKVRARVINNFGHRSKEDWDEAMSSGLLGQYVPNYPEEMYAPEWVSWDEWLGLMRSYNDTKNIASNVLGLKSLDEYLIFVKSNSKRSEGLRIPVRPDIYYKDEWIDEESFFGK